MESKKIYIAGPEVFCPNASKILEEKKKLCLQYGYIGLTPYDTEISKKENNIENYYFPINIMFSDAIIKKSFEECLIDIKNNHS